MPTTGVEVPVSMFTDSLSSGAFQKSSDDGSVAGSIAGSQTAASSVRSLERLVAHHDALRLAFRDEGGRVIQCYREGREPELSWHVDVSGEADLAAAVERVANRAHRSLNLERGPLLRAVSITRGPSLPGRLLLTVHLVMDGVSFRVLLEDLNDLYAAPSRIVERAPVTPRLDRPAQNVD